MNPTKTIRDVARRLGRDERGGVAVWFGVMCIPLLFFAGSGMDLARGFNQKTAIQGAVDEAALAGAGAYTTLTNADAAKAVADNFMESFKTANNLTSLTYKSTPGLATGASGGVVAFTMKVDATSMIPNTLMQMTKGSNAVGASATAQNPAYSLTVSMAGFSSSAIDSNSISYYVVPADGSAPTTTTPLFTNTGTGQSSGSLVLPATASQKIGFMLTNKTDGNATQSKCTYNWYGRSCTQGNDYGPNQYGGQSQSVHYFYSHMMPPSKLAYPGVTQNCSLQVVVDSNAAPAAGCTSSLPQFATVSCVQAAGKVLHYYWNDMGGTTDDKDFNDAAYTVACAQVGSGTQKLALVK